MFCDTIGSVAAQSGEANTASNLGGGVGIFNSKAGVDLEFKSLTSGTGITLTPSATEILIETSAEANTASNLGTGEGVFAQKNLVDLEFKSLTAGAGITITPSATELLFATTAEANTASNLGTGEGVFAQKNLVDLEFKSLKAGTNVTLTPSATEILIEASGGITWSTPIDAHITVTGDELWNIGTASAAPNIIYSNYQEMYAPNAYFYMDNEAGQYIQLWVTDPASASYGPVNVNSALEFFGNGAIVNSGGEISIWSADGGSGSGTIHINTENSGASPSGGFHVTLGSGTSQGEFKFLKTGVAPTVGHVWTASAVDGTGYWAAPSGGSAAAVGAKILVPGNTTGFSSPAQVSFNNTHQVFDTGGIIGTNELVVPSAGYYMITGWCYAPSNTGFVVFYYQINASPTVSFSGLAPGVSGAYTSASGTAVAYLNASDAVKMHIYSATPGGIPANAAGNITFSVMKLGE